MGGFSFFSDLISPTKYDVPDAAQVDVDKEQLANAKSNLASFDSAKELAQQFNDYMSQQVQSRLKQTQPYLGGIENQVADNYSKQLRGELSLSDAAASQRGSVAKSLGLGLGGSQAGSALTLRNLGLTQYGVQQNAQANAPNFLNQMASLRRAPMFDFSNVFMSPQQRIQTQQWNATNRWNVQNLQNQMAVQPEPWMKATAGLGDSLVNAAGSYFTMGGMGGLGGGQGYGGSGSAPAGWSSMPSYEQGYYNNQAATAFGYGRNTNFE